MREAQQDTMTQQETMTQTACLRRPAAETPADLGQVTGDRLSLTAFAKPTQTQGQETRRRKT